MSASDSETIDLVALDPIENRVVLIVVEEREWGDSGALLPDLQAKLNTYLAYIEEGRLVEDFPQAAAKRIRLEVRCTYSLGAKEVAFLNLVERESLRPAGIDLRWRLIGERPTVS